MLGDVFDGLITVAAADGVLHPSEDRFLAEVATRFGYGRGEYRAMLACHIRDADSAYAALGLEPSANDRELKARHRQLARELHPDALVANGVPAKFRAQAEQRLAKINASFDIIARERGLKEQG